ncbi:MULTISPECIES: epoxide hydrolase family protein [unclassified Microbacterium]|uniref:epoxide hydrolase family protein n=1 Tax=unclassified Microbacterium TaxID=2609290 RepID=UPI000CFCC00E|nr:MULTISPECIES: epoxide hydrolase family protein [unclassified Microbacterium]PQZ58253.1 epoxide hydrolase [Microbacterium sp. MYb43]PQZ78351.1 epoxide hydrolase [Microbacterium sp. MYb40]PRB20582.1 epoxide hydrolase [Microbacterium sp. MYb54]PRB28333.1 epoxide hydrolase [Microbacterium sp. MYb50]PRB66604.1 epoxide hydrolase [Microbacterium sp. MYb24]
MPVTPFRIRASDDALEELRDRVSRARFVAPSDATTWSAGVDPPYLQQLATYWAAEFDWRSVEAAIDEYPQFLAETDGDTLHFVHIRAAAPSSKRLPVVLLHGWPSTFVEMLPLADRIAHPERFGRDPATARDVVIPSLPGFLFSSLPSSPLTRQGMAHAIDRLMTEDLGYSRYCAFGGDVGGTVTAWLGADHPKSVAAIHMIHPPFPASFDVPPLTAEEETFLAAEEAYDETDGGYSAIMITRPDTIAAALIDSPIGLVAWLADKYRDWSDCDGDIERRFRRDDVLTAATLYWITGSIGTSMRQYYDYDHNPDRPMIEVPAGFTLSHEPSMAGFPRSIAERACSRIVQWNEPQRGGHFMPHEEPDLLAADLEITFRLAEQEDGLEPG